MINGLFNVNVNEVNEVTETEVTETFQCHDPTISQRPKFNKCFDKESRNSRH